MKKVLFVIAISSLFTGCAQVGGSLSKQANLSQTMPSFNQCRSYVFNMSKEMTSMGGTLLSFHEDLNQQVVNISVRGPNGRVGTLGCQNNLMTARV